MIGEREGEIVCVDERERQRERQRESLCAFVRSYVRAGRRAGGWAGMYACVRARVRVVCGWVGMRVWSVILVAMFAVYELFPDD